MVEIDGKEGLHAWLLKQKGKPRTFTCEGVIMELENGDEYGVPFFFFSDDDLKILKPGWEQWIATQDDIAQHEQQALYLQSLAEAHQQDRQVRQQVATMQLQLLAAATGAVKLWEVRLYPGRGVAGPPVTVVVPGTNSATATAAALKEYPGFVRGPVRKVR
jgi:hypothetical protein